MSKPEPLSPAGDAASTRLATAPDQEIPPEPATIETLLAGALEYFSPELLGFAQRAVALGESQISDSSARGDAAGAAQWDPAHCDRRGVSKP
jgi:hypothetical protein